MKFFQFPFQGKTLIATINDGAISCDHPCFSSFFGNRRLVPADLESYGLGADKFERLPIFVLCHRLHKYWYKNYLKRQRNNGPWD